ncbi:unnamed protein product [Blepharisma stoltei]|uniref:Ribosomal protein S16 n=1 Tax=Blepharisma stoltei TaxID=1481888 RepID=A0AAU9K165_9CILI|nr:unnamed protein product [Blepharisma stoltei]
MDIFIDVKSLRKWFGLNKFSHCIVQKIRFSEGNLRFPPSPPTLLISQKKSMLRLIITGFLRKMLIN